MKVVNPFGKHQPYTLPCSAPVWEVPANALLTTTDMRGSGWTTAGQLLTQNVTGPNGQTGWTGTDSSTSTHLINAPIIATGHHAGIVAKAGTNSWLGIQSTTAAKITSFDLTNGVVGTNGFDSAEITAIGSGWYYCTVYSAAGDIKPTFKNADSQAHCTLGTSFASTGTILYFGPTLF